MISRILSDLKDYVSDSFRYWKLEQARDVYFLRSQDICRIMLYLDGAKNIRAKPVFLSFKEYSSMSESEIILNLKNQIDQIVSGYSPSPHH